VKLLSPFKPRARLLDALALGVALVACDQARGAERGAAHAGAPARIVSAGGSVTECVAALGFASVLVGVDATSLHPEPVTRLPQVGVHRMLSSEGVLSLRPDLVLVSSDAGPPAALEQIRTSGVRLAVIPSEHSLAGAQEKVRAVARALGAAERGDALASAIARDVESARAAIAAALDGRARPRVLFLYARGAGSPLVSGRGTAADAMLALAGAENAVTAYEGYKPLSSEAAVAAAPDAILMPERALQGLGGADGVLALPGLRDTPAGRARRVVGMDDGLLLGFGPRLAQAVRELASRLDPRASDLAGGASR